MFTKTRAASMAALTGALLLASNPALASEDLVSTALGDVPTRVVSYADLDLLQAKDVTRLNTRVRRVAQTVCDVGGIKPLSQVVLSDACFDGAMERAARDIEIAVASARSGEQMASNAAVRGIAVRTR